jgi:hypothetical protein
MNIDNKSLENIAVSYVFGNNSNKSKLYSVWSGFIRITLATFSSVSFIITFPL